MSREAMKQALEAFDALYMNDYSGYEISKHESYIIDDAVKALRQALETEPFEYRNAVGGWVKIDEVREHFDAVGCGTIYKSAGEGRSPLYTAPPNREWVGLTDQEIHEIDGYEEDRKIYRFARYIEAKLKEKNGH
jgi:hypothetical protein